MKKLLLLAFLTCIFNSYAQDISIDNVTVSPVTCNGQQDGSISFSVSNFTNTYQYTINNGTPVTAQSSAIVELTNLVIGEYTIEVMDETTNVLDTVLVTVTGPEVLTITTTAVNISCFGDNGELIVDVTGGLPPYLYSINGGVNQTSNIFPGLNPDNYMVTVQDSNACIAVSPIIVITEPEALTLNLISTEATCNGNGSITLEATGGVAPYEYKIDGVTNYQTSNDFVVVESGEYTVSVRDANACIEQLSVVVEIPDILNATTNVNGVLCSGDSNGEIVVNVTGGVAPYSYRLDDNTSTSTNDDFFVFSNLQSGSYNVYVEDSNLCIYQLAVNIVEPSVLTITTTTVVDVSCFGDNNGQLVVDNVVGGLPPYLYSINGGDYQASNVFAELIPGEYTVTVQDVNACLVTSPGVVITEPEALIATIEEVIDSGDEPSGKITINTIGGVPPYTYSLDNITYTASNIITDVAAGNYDLFVRDANNCFVTQQITIGQISIDNTVSISSGNQLGATFTGANSYQWINVDTNTRIPGATNSTYTPTVSGNYQVEMTIDDGATTKATLSKTGKSSSIRALQTVLSPVIEVNLALSTDDIDANSIKIYPNPVRDYISISHTFTDKTYRIYNLLGSEVVNGKTVQKLDVSALSNGIYVLQIEGYKPKRFIKE